MTFLTTRDGDSDSYPKFVVHSDHNTDTEIDTKDKQCFVKTCIGGLTVYVKHKKSMIKII